MSIGKLSLMVKMRSLFFMGLIVTGNLVFAQPLTLTLSAGSADIRIDRKGFIHSIKDRRTKKEYCPTRMSSALLSLCNGNVYVLPDGATFKDAGGGVIFIRLSYPNGSVARIKASKKDHYLRLELSALENPNGVDNIVWGPYKTTISKTIGDLFSVVRSGDYAIGIMGLNDNTTSGPPTDGDMSFMYYYIHSPDPTKYPLPANLKEGQTFSIGGDGVNDVAFYSRPEEYFRMNYGNGARLEPAYGSTITMHSRDRRREQMIRFPVLPDNLDGKANSARYQIVSPTNADFVSSAIAMYTCPDSLGLATIEKIVQNEGLPHPMVDGKWIKDPAAYRPDLAWHGPHDSLASYTAQLGLKGVQDEGWGEYYPNPANRWSRNNINFRNLPDMSIPAYGTLIQKSGIRYGLHTLCEFLQPGSSDVSPVPSDSLAIMQRTTLTRDIAAEDSIITVADTAHFNEFGGWEGNHTNVLKIGKELIEYDGITRTWPYTFLKIKRGFHNTVREAYKAGTTIVKLQPNCYRGFAPDMNLQDIYADYYGKWLTDGGMDYIDFDGLESCMYQGHGQYSFKRFFRGLFDSYYRNGGKYLRVMGSAVQEGSWHYMSVCNVGGGNNMFDPVHNKWGIEGKDMRYVFESSYFPATFGIQYLDSDWSLYDVENLQAKSIGWNATYMLGLSQQSVEASGLKPEIFKAYKVWENARAAGVFTRAQKEKLKDMSCKFHLEQNNASAFTLYTLKEDRVNLPYKTDGVTLPLRYSGTGINIPEWTIRVHTPKNVKAGGIRISLPDGRIIQFKDSISNGQFIICKDLSLYLADEGRKKQYDLLNGQPLLTGKVGGIIKLSALDRGNEKVSLEMVSTVVLKKERVGAGLLFAGIPAVAQATAKPSDKLLDKALEAVQGTVRFSQRRFNGTELVSETPFSKGRSQNDGASWGLTLQADPVPGHAGTVDVKAVFRLEAGEAKSTAVAANFDWSGWSAKNYVLVPAIVYNGNRYRSIGNGYSPAYPPDMFFNPQVPLTISNNPRLSIEPGQSSLLELQTGNAATPAICFFSPDKKKGFILLTEQQTRLGNSGLTIAENGAKDSCSFSLSAPAVRRLAPGFGDFHPSGDTAPDWKAGDEVTIHFRIYVFDTKDIPGLLEKFMTVRKDVSGPNRPRNQLPKSKLLELDRKICHDNFVTVPAGSYYLPENNQDFQLGWVSGMINSYLMLATGDSMERRRVMAELDFVTEKLQGSSGYFYGGITANGQLRPDKQPTGSSLMTTIVRKNGDDLFWLLKHLLLLKAQGFGSSIKPSWEKSVKRLAGAFAASWQAHGEFGQYVVPETGAIAVFNSTAGAIVPAGMAMAAQYFNNPVWGKIAADAALYYYQRDVVKQGMTGGDCGDISQDANSESAFGFMESLMAMYYYSGDVKWLRMARVQAALCATWAFSYDPVFPAHSDIGRLDCRMAGAIWASIQNKHAAPGICTSSGDDLFKLFRATGDKCYADLICDIQHAQVEAINRPGHITTNNLIGSCMERIQLSDAEGRESTGNFINTRNSWTETDGMLMALEIPGIYIRTDKKSLYVFDHVEARIIGHDAGGIIVEIHNATSFDATVSIMAETGVQATRPLAYTAFTQWQKVTVEAGKTIQVRIGAG